MTIELIETLEAIQTDLARPANERTYGIYVELGARLPAILEDLRRGRRVETAIRGARTAVDAALAEDRRVEFNGNRVMPGEVQPLLKFLEMQVEAAG